MHLSGRIHWENMQQEANLLLSLMFSIHSVLLITPMAVGRVSLLAKFCLLLYPFGLSFATS